ncbi:hypothetical protein FJZ23_02615 [Candidatus Parcubacteria bacterium]|nr:hypothetical protein [Candidatus Parcubacteria bacterium]
MSPLLLAEESLIGWALADAGLVLFGVTLLFVGATLTLTILLRRDPKLVWPLVGLLTIQIMLLIGMIVLDVWGAREMATLGAVSDLSTALATHRYLLIQLPFLLMVVAETTLIVYGEQIVERHARPYYLATILSVWLAFAALVAIGMESMF